VRAALEILTLVGSRKKTTIVGPRAGDAQAKAGHRVLFDIATGWVERLQAAHSRSTLSTELARLRRASLLIVDEVGYIPFDQDAANLFFQLESSRYEHASLIMTSNLPFARWGDVFGDLTIASAMIDRIVHHADVITLKGTSYRLKGHSTETTTTHQIHTTAALFSVGVNIALRTRSLGVSSNSNWPWSSRITGSF